MNLKRLLAIIVFLSLAGLASPTLAETFIVFPIESSQSMHDDAVTMAQLLRQRLENLDDTKVYGTQGAKCGEVGCAKKVRNQRDVDCVVIGELRSLGGQLMLMLNAVWDDDVISYSVPLESSGEFVKVSNRLAEAIRYQKNWEGNRGTDSVSKGETHPYENKVHGMTKLGANIGMIAPQNNTYLGADFLTNFNALFRYEIAQVGIEVDAGFSYSNTLDAVRISYYDENADTQYEKKYNYYLTQYPVNIGAHYYFIDGDISPFIGGGGGISYVQLTPERDLDKKSAEQADYWMFLVRAYAGVDILRTHTFQMNFRAGYQYGFVDFKSDLKNLKNDNDRGAHGVFAQIGFTFGN